jgi:hypothetical protein
MLKNKLNFGKRPICSIKGCRKERQFMGTYKKDGSPQFRNVCSGHHHERCAERMGVTKSEWANSFHAYRQFRKDYCENRDGRLGFVCRIKIRIPAQLQVDHKNGNPSDNRKRNLQTLCACCHIFKTHMNKDYMSAGRKTLKVSC